MKFFINPDGVQGKRLYTEHNGLELHWYTTDLLSTLGKKSTEDVYGLVNTYISGMSSTAVNKLYKLYVDIYIYMDNITEVPTDNSTFTEFFIALCDIIKPADVKKWLIGRKLIYYSPETMVEYDGSNIREKTYILSEYDDLVVLAFMCRIALPVWGGYARLQRVKDAYYKETSAIALLQGTPIQDLPAMARLQSYCDASVEMIGDDVSAGILKHMGTSEMPGYFIASALVRCATVVRIHPPADGGENKKNLIALIYSTLTGLMTTFSTGVKDKRSNKFRADDGEESVTEQYRRSQVVADYAVVTASVFMDDMTMVANTLVPPVDVGRCNSYLEMLNSSGNTVFSIAGYHTPLCAIVVKQVVHPRTLTLISRDTFMKVIAVSAAYYHERGNIELARLLMSPWELVETGGGPLGRCYPFKALTEENEEVLDKLYPYKRRDNKGRVLANPGEEMIEGIIREINTYGYPHGDTMVPLDLRNIITDILTQGEEYVRSD